MSQLHYSMIQPSTAHCLRFLNVKNVSSTQLSSNLLTTTVHCYEVTMKETLTYLPRSTSTRKHNSWQSLSLSLCPSICSLPSFQSGSLLNMCEVSEEKVRNRGSNEMTKLENLHLPSSFTTFNMEHTYFCPRSSLLRSRPPSSVLLLISCVSSCSLARKFSVVPTIESPLFSPSPPPHALPPLYPLLPPPPPPPPLLPRPPLSKEG